MSAKPKPKPRKNLTFAQWTMVLAYVDEHPKSSQEEIVKHFSERHEGPLKFTQSTLSRKIEHRSKLEALVILKSSALDGKRPRVVRSPKTEEALVSWAIQLEQNGKTVSSSMLIKKREASRSGDEHFRWGETD